MLLNRTKQNQAKPKRTKRSRAKPAQTKTNRTKPSHTKPSQNKPSQTSFYPGGVVLSFVCVCVGRVGVARGSHCLFLPRSCPKGFIGLVPFWLSMSTSSQSWTHIRARCVQFRRKKKLKTYRFCLLSFLQKNGSLVKTYRFCILLFLQKNGSLVAPPGKPSTTCTRLIDMRLYLDRTRVCHL